jgi:hypothetical protein
MSALLNAARVGDLVRLQSLIAGGVDVTERNHRGVGLSSHESSGAWSSPDVPRR